MRFSIGSAVISKGGEFLGVIINKDSRGWRVWWEDGDITGEGRGRDMALLTTNTKINKKKT